MSDPAAVFQGSYADIVVRKTRSVFVVSVEFPLEAYQAFVAAFGGPTPGAEVPVALARLDPSKPASEPRKGNGEAVKERRKFHELPLRMQAALRCADPDFCHYLTTRDDIRLSDEIIIGTDEAAAIVRQFCEVNSRRDLLPGTQGASRWETLNNAFLDWKHGIPLPESAR